MGALPFRRHRSRFCCPLGTCRLNQTILTTGKWKAEASWTRTRGWDQPCSSSLVHSSKRVLWLVVAAAELLGAKTVVFCVCNKAVSPVSWPSELLPAWHFIINTFFSFLVLVSCHFIAFKVLFLFYSSLPIDRKYPGFSKQQRQT